MNKEKLILIASTTADDLMRLSVQEQMHRESFISSIENADNPRLHMFVASNNWQELVIQMKDTVALLGIKYMLPKFKKVSVYLFGEITLRMVQTLGEIYPEKAAEFRKAYMQGLDIGGLLNGE